MPPLAHEADSHVTKAMEGFASPDGDVGIEFLVGLGDGVEEAPDAASSKFTVGGLAPFAEDFGDLGGGDGATIQCPDDEVVGLVVRDTLLLVGVDALVELKEAVTELPDGAAGEVAKVALGEAGVLAAEFDLSAEGEVVADEDLGSGDHGGREGFVVAVSQSDDPAVVAVLMLGELDFEEAEIPGTFVANRVGLATEDEAAVAKLFFNFLKQVLVRHGIPGLGVRRCRDFGEGFASDLLRSAVEEKSGRRFLDDFGFDKVVHGF